jgi:hypothetical protein
MSVIDWTPGPLLRGMMDLGADAHMAYMGGAYHLTVSQGDHRASRIRETAQAAADAMEQGLRERMGRDR